MITHGWKIGGTVNIDPLVFEARRSDADPWSYVHVQADGELTPPVPKHVHWITKVELDDDGQPKADIHLTYVGPAL
jgi:hypothetical protein